VVDWLADMNYYDMPVHQHPLREGVRDNTNHYVTGRDGGRDIDLRAFAMQGMKLYGLLQGLQDGQLQFAPGLTQALDHADQIYNGINVAIDKHIAAQGIEAPPPSVYESVWAPEQEVRTLDIAQAGITSVVWMRRCSMAGVSPCTSGASRGNRACISWACPGSTPGVRGAFQAWRVMLCFLPSRSMRPCMARPQSWASSGPSSTQARRASMITGMAMHRLRFRVDQAGLSSVK